MANPTSITVGSNTYSLVTMPSTPGWKTISFSMIDSIATVTSPFTLQSQTQQWAGADLWQATMSLPPMNRAAASNWLAFLMQLRGSLCVFQLGDPTGALPQGTPMGAPLVDGTTDTNNAVSTSILYTKGWTASTYRLLYPGDYIQIGYRLYTCLDSVESDSGGNAQINIFPSLREQPADGTALTLHNTTGLFRLADNTRQFSYDWTNLYAVSLKATEVR